MWDAEIGKLHEKCLGCEKIVSEKCSVYNSPMGYWRRGRCPMATHIKLVVVSDSKVRMGQQKQKKAKKKK